MPTFICALFLNVTTHARSQVQERGLSTTVTGRTVFFLNVVLPPYIGHSVHATCCTLYALSLAQMQHNCNMYSQLPMIFEQHWCNK